jgi:ABC-type lipoprotein export system ATPase subunit
VARGEKVVVVRYQTEKVALVNPEDLALLEQSHDLLETLTAVEPLEVDGLALKTRATEDRPDAGGSIEDASALDALLDL